ncbi:MAG: hypothetical protein QG641_446 [Candidatus Poribacteria bacterium]|nr:hypothetical protein [Candidatus Poribacteria bacterium]
MLYKVIDPNFILSDTYREWPFETKTTYTIICALANNKTGEFFHSIETIAHHANVCKRAVQRSLRRIEDVGVITKIERPGNTSIYKYNFSTNIRKKDRDDSLVRSDSPVMGVVTEQSSPERLTGHPIESKNDPQAPIKSIFTDTIPFPNKQDLNKHDLTTTYSDKLLSELISKYGKEKVFENAVAVSKLEGIKNKEAYLRSSLKGGYVPINQKQKEKEEAEQRRLEIEKRQKQKLIEWEQHIERVKQEENDPEVQARIRAEFEKMNRMFNDTKT